MGCRKCGAQTPNRLCRRCELDDRFGEPIDEDDDPEDEL